MKPTLIVMAKTPTRGLAKRRLALDVGEGEALRFYRSALAVTLARLGRDPRWRVVIAVTPDSAVNAPVWRRLASPYQARLKPQGRDAMGVRMQTLLEAEQGETLLIGSDIPSVLPCDIALAFKRLAGADAVFGPAADGGFWLAGLKHPQQVRPFENVRWSSRYTLSDVLENLRGRRTVFTTELQDVDTGASYRQSRSWAARRIAPRHLSLGSG